VAATGFVLALLLPERRLRDGPATSKGLEDGLAAPRSPDSLAEIERSLTRVTTADERRRFREQVGQRAGIDLSSGALWALVRIEEHGFQAARSQALEIGVPDERIVTVLGELSELGLVAGDEGGRRLTAAGEQQAARILAARRELLAEALAGDGAPRDPEVRKLLARLARELAGEPPLATA
jgi:hypothetical protein